MHVSQAELFAPRIARLPAPNGRLRLFTFLDERDSARYCRAVSRVVDVVERALGPGIHADRTVKASLTQEPWRWARRRFHRHLVQAVVDRSPSNSFLVRTDVRNYFGSIRPASVEEALRFLGGGRRDVSAVRDLLDRFAGAGVPGLPVGPAPSGVLAGAVLAATDSALALDGGAVFRWVDDYVVLTRSERHAERALRILKESLAEAGLEIAPEKTAVLPAAPSIPFDLSASFGRGIRLESGG